MQFFSHFLIFGQLALLSIWAERPTEQERVALWKQKNVWPPNWQQESDAYKMHQLEREIEIMQLPGSDERWENWMQFTQGQLVPKFTEKGINGRLILKYYACLKQIQYKGLTWSQLREKFTKNCSMQ